jgi:predicted nucleic acid-binding protein
MKIMLDSNAYDKVIATPDLLSELERVIAEGRVELVSTHIQDDELDKVPDSAKKEALKKILTRNVPTTEFVIGTSRIGQAKIGVGESCGIRYADIQRGNPKHIEDALIALAAAAEADVLVTEETRLFKKVRTASTTLQVWKFVDLENYIKGLKGKQIGYTQ